jgi:hypothetical protein
VPADFGKVSNCSLTRYLSVIVLVVSYYQQKILIRIVIIITTIIDRFSSVIPSFDEGKMSMYIRYHRRLSEDVFYAEGGFLKTIRP